MIWFLMFFNIFLMEKVFSFIFFFSYLTVIIFFMLVLIFLKAFMEGMSSKASKAYHMQLEINTIIEPTFRYVYIFSHFSIR